MRGHYRGGERDAHTLTPCGSPSFHAYITTFFRHPIASWVTTVGTPCGVEWPGPLVVELSGSISPPLGSIIFTDTCVAKLIALRAWVRGVCGFNAGRGDNVTTPSNDKDSSEQDPGICLDTHTR